MVRLDGGGEPAIDDKYAKGSVDALKKALMVAGKKLGKKLGKSLLKLLAPYLPTIAVILLFLFILVGLIGVVYSGFPSNSILLGNTLTAEDAELKKRYEGLADKYNHKDVYLVSSNSSKENPYYPGKGTYFEEGLSDHYGNDVELKMGWGLIHSALLYKAYALDQKNLDLSMAESVADEFHPTFYYRKSTITYCDPPDKDGKRSCSTETINLLVEAYTVKGHFVFKYKPMQTDHYPSGATKRWEPPDGVEQLLPNPWMRLDNWVTRELKMNNAPEISLARTALYEAGKGFTKKTEALAWLLERYSPSVYTSSAMIPPNLYAYFKEASERFNIPVWFLAAVAWIESNFMTDSDNSGTGSPVYCYGIMQVSDSNWKAYAPILGFDPVADRDNPRAQIMVGAYMLAELGLKNVDWNSPDWKEQTLPILTKYGGFIKVPATKPYSTVEEWCREEYAKKIWETAEALKTDAVWPVPGKYTLSNRFGKVDTSLYKDYHHGVDIVADTGDQVVSVSAGIVTGAEWDGVYGNCVKVTDGSHLYLYAHLSQIQVTKGKAMKPGDKIGLVGATGNAKGSHLHFEVRDLSKGSGLDACIDPLSIIHP
ncbi:MAG: M23 family metallopeptidase [Firmicutes bacterium]|nr:M23 family metallopeptidase [Bacillota bacterium]